MAIPGRTSPKCNHIAAEFIPILATNANCTHLGQATAAQNNQRCGQLSQVAASYCMASEAISFKALNVVVHHTH